MNAGLIGPFQGLMSHRTGKVDSNEDLPHRRSRGAATLKQFDNKDNEGIVLSPMQKASSHVVH